MRMRLVWSQWFQKLRSDAWLVITVASVVVLTVAVGRHLVQSRGNDRAHLQLAAVDLAALGPTAQRQLVSTIIDVGDLAQCDRATGVVLGGTDYRTVCRNNIFYERAITNLDLDACRHLDGQLMNTQDCQRQVVLLRIEQGWDLASCDDAADSDLKTLCQDTYWHTAAVQGEDPNLCGELSTKESQAACRDEALIARLIVAPGEVRCPELSAPFVEDCQTFKRAQSGAASCGAIVLSRLQAACAGQ